MVLIALAAAAALNSAHAERISPDRAARAQACGQLHLALAKTGVMLSLQDQRLDDMDRVAAVDLRSGAAAPAGDQAPWLRDVVAWRRMVEAFRSPNASLHRNVAEMGDLAEVLCPRAPAP